MTRTRSVSMPCSSGHSEHRSRVAIACRASTPPGVARAEEPVRRRNGRGSVFGPLTIARADPAASTSCSERSPTTSTASRRTMAHGLALRHEHPASACEPRTRHCGRNLGRDRPVRPMAPERVERHRGRGRVVPRRPQSPWPLSNSWMFVAVLWVARFHRLY